MSAVNLKLYDFARQELKLSDDKAKEFIAILEETIKEDIKASTSDYKSLWKDDFHSLDKRIVESKNEMYKAIFLSSLLQLIAILGGVLAIVKFALNK